MDCSSGFDAVSEPYVAISKTQYDQMRLACELLHAGTKHMENMEQLLQSCQRNDIETLVEAWIPERSNPHELFRRCLDNPRKELFEINGKWILDEVKHISESLFACISNSWDTINEKGWRSRTLEQRETHERARSLQLISMVSNMARLRNFKTTPPLLMMTTYRFYWHGSQQNLLGTQVATRNCLGHDWFLQMTERLEDYTAPLLFEEDTGYMLFAVDNLEFYLKRKFQRRLWNGEKLLNEILHTVTGWKFPLPRNLIKFPVPRDMENWPYEKQWDPKTVLLSAETINTELKDIWLRARLFSLSDDMSYLRRPPEELDQKQNFGGHGKKNPKIALPIILECGTHSTNDAQKIIDHIRKLYGANVKKLICGDMQTFKNLFFLKFNNAAANNDWVCMAGEWHEMAHLLDGIVRLNWKHIYEPICLFHDIKGLQYKLNMKHTSVRLRWTMVIANAGFKWLRSVFGELAITDPVKLLVDCRRNVPVYNFISFIFYFANPLWACRFATQCSDSDLMDFVWKYSLLVFNVTNKEQYRKGVLQDGLSLFDTEPNIRNIIRHCRFVSESGNPCTGVALDYAVELVCKTYVIPIETLPYNLSDGYPSSRLGLTSCMIVIFIEFYDVFIARLYPWFFILTISVCHRR